MQFQFAQPNTSLAMNVAAAPVVFGAPAGAPPSGFAMNVAAVAPGAPKTGTQKPVLTGTGTTAMGAGFVLIDKALAARLNHTERQGVFVGRVAPNTAAAASGLNPGDIILKIDGRRIRDPGQAVSTLAARKSGEVARLGILRNGKDTQVYLVVADMTAGGGTGPAAGMSPAAGMAAAGGPNPGANNAPPRRVPNEFNWMGLEVEAFSMVRPVGAPGAKPIQGARINEVTRGSAAEKAGIKIGDLLVEINRLPVTNAGQMDRAIRAANGQPGKLLKLMRGTETFFAVLP
jgi:serine protease Do